MTPYSEKQERINNARKNQNNKNIAGKHAKGRCRYDGQQTKGGCFGNPATREKAN